MGSLVLPVAGPIHIDANVVLYTVNRHPTYYPLLQPLWAAARNSPQLVRGSHLLILECLVGPIRTNDAALLRDTEDALFWSDLSLSPISEAVLREAANIRAATPAVRAPDAIHAASALLDGVAMFLTNDLGFKRVVGLPVVLLDDVLANP